MGLAARIILCARLGCALGDIKMLVNFLPREQKGTLSNVVTSLALLSCAKALTMAIVVLLIASLMGLMPAKAMAYEQTYARSGSQYEAASDFASTSNHALGTPSSVRGVEYGHAADYPVGSITIICAHERGSDVDYNTRLLATLFEVVLNVKVNVQNVGANNGALAFSQYAETRPDGYTLLATDSLTLAANHVTSEGDISYSSFESVGVFGKQAGEFLVTHPKARLRTLDDILKEAQVRPRSLRFGVSLGGSSFVTALGLMAGKGVDFALVDTGLSDTARMQMLMSRQIDVTTLPYNVAKKYVQMGEIRLVASLNSERIPHLQEVPTILEQGYRNLGLDAYFVLLAPRGTEPGIVEKLNTLILNIATRSNGYKQAVRAYNYQTPFALSSVETRSLLRKQQLQFTHFAKYLKEESVVYRNTR